MGRVKIVLMCSGAWGVAGMDKVGRNNQLQVISGLANFIKLVMVWRCVFDLLHEWIHHGEWDTGELWHVPSGTRVFITLAKVSLMGYSWLMGGKGWKI